MNMKILAETSKNHKFALYYQYDPRRVDFCRALKETYGWNQFAYDGECKRWVFSNPMFVKMFKDQFPDTYIDPMVLKVAQAEDASLRASNAMQELVTEIKAQTETDFDVRGLKGQLKPYQRVGVEFALASGGKCIISDQMGLGKSLQAIAYIKHKELRRTLVVAPASVKYSWEKELKKWTNLSYVLIDSQTDLNKIDASVEVWIINYELLKKNINTLTKVHFDCLIGDEAQYCKNLTAQRTKAFRLIARNILSVILLTGTPLLSRPVELYTLLNIIDPLTWNNYYEYVRRYCNAHQTRYGLDVSGVSNIEELSTRIQRYYIRRKKSDVLTDLPEKIHIPFPVQLEKQKAQEYDKAEENFAEYLIEHSGKQPAEVAKTLQAEKLARLNVLRQLCSQGKLPAAYELIDSILESREKILIFSSFVAPLEELHTHYGDKAVILTGKTEMGERGKIVERFQTDSDVKILLGGFKSAGVGLTLTAATAVIALDLPWNPADMQQAIDRAHRIGQTGSVSVYYITARGTIDDKLQEILDRKQKIFDKLIDGTTDDNTNSGKDINETINTILAKHIKSHARKNFEVHEGKV